MVERNQLPYLPLDVLVAIASYTAKNNLDDWKQFKLASHDFSQVPSDDLSYNWMNLEDYSHPWMPNDTWYQLRMKCRKAQNLYDVFVETTRQLHKEGATP